MNIWIVAPRAEQERLIEPLAAGDFRVFCSETTLAAFDAMPPGRLSADVFVIGGMTTGAAAHAVSAIRAHPTLWGAPILVVADRLSVSDTIVLNGAGADLFYGQRFEPRIYVDRVREAIALKRSAKPA